MKATGIVRRIDDLGRVVIPKEIRRTMRIREGDPLEIYTQNGGEIIFKKYSPLGELSSLSSQYVQVLNKITGLPCVITDREQVICSSGISKKEVMERRISPQLDEMMQNRKTYQLGRDKEKQLPLEGVERESLVSVPILNSGDLIGSVILLMGEVPTSKAEDTSLKLAEAAAMFLGLQIES